jgi:hypothetical protein
VNEEERVSAAHGIAALNASLAVLGRPPIGANPEVRIAAPIIGDVPNAVVEKPGVAPLRLVFGRNLDIWVGPYSEVVTITSDEESRELMETLITRVLKSEVLCLHRRKSVELILRMPEQDPWLRLVVRGAPEAPTLEPHYEPYGTT